MATITKDLGIATAYGYARSKGYTGTEEEFAELMASYASVAEQAEDARDAAQAWAEGTEDEEALQYNNNALYYKGLAQDAATAAEKWATGLTGGTAGASNNAKKFSQEAEAWATGEIGGTPVGSTAPQYENSAAYWAGIARGYKQEAQAAAATAAGEAAQDALSELGLTIVDGKLNIIYEEA